MPPTQAAASSSSAGKKRKAVSGADVVAQIIALCESESAGIAQVALEAALEANGINKAAMLTALNDLLKRGKVVACPALDKSLTFRLQSDEDVERLRDLTAEDRLVFQEIEASQIAGISTKDLRTKTSLPAQALTKALKKLETRKLVKQVKSVSAKNKKIYMLCAPQRSKMPTPALLPFPAHPARAVQITSSRARRSRAARGTRTSRSSTMS